MRDTITSFFLIGLSILLVLLLFSCGGEGGKGKTHTVEDRWTSTFGGQYDDWGTSVQQTSEGGYIIVGRTYSFGAGNSDVYLIKTDSHGVVLWTKTFGGQYDDWGTSVQQTSDGGYIIIGAGAAAPLSAVFGDVYLIKTDSDGNAMWSKRFGGSGWAEGVSVQQTLDGGYIIVGARLNLYEDNSSVYLVKTNSVGDILWEKTYSGDGFAFGTSVQQTLDGGYIIAGGTAGNSYLLKTDSFGNLIWSKTFDLGYWDSMHSAQQTSDRGYIVLGHTFAGGFVDDFLVKTDNDGNLIWKRGLYNVYCRALHETSDGGYIIAGSTVFFEQYSDVYLLKTDSYGNSLWEKSIGGKFNDDGRSVQQTSDGGFIVVGNTESFDTGGVDVYLIKTDSKGNIQ